MKTIIAPTDFSPISVNAVHYAVDLACSINASIHLLHVYQLPMMVSEIPVSAEMVDSIEKDAEEKMLKLKIEINKRAGKKVKIYSRIKMGTVLHEIEDMCKSLKPYAVVMGTQGSGAVKRALLGSNTLAAIRQLSCPLIAVPEQAKFAGITKMGLACDMKKVIDTMPSKEIKHLVKDFNAALHVIYINSEGDWVEEPKTVEQSAFLQEMLEELHPSYHTLNNPFIEEGINKYIKRNHLEMLIVVPKKHNLVEKLFHKSLSKELVLHTQVPILAIHE